MHSATLTQVFLRYFGVNLAATRELQEQAAKIRYRVYCEESGYESTENFPQRLGKDEFDAQALSCLVSYKRNGLPVEQIADFMEYHGQRPPHYLAPPLVKDTMRHCLRVLYAAIYNRLSIHFSAQEAVA